MKRDEFEASLIVVAFLGMGVLAVALFGGMPKDRMKLMFVLGPFAVCCATALGNLSGMIRARRNCAAAEQAAKQA